MFEGKWKGLYRYAYLLNMLYAIIKWEESMRKLNAERSKYPLILQNKPTSEQDRYKWPSSPYAIGTGSQP